MYKLELNDDLQEDKNIKFNGRIQGVIKQPVLSARRIPGNVYFQKHDDFVAIALTNL